MWWLLWLGLALVGLYGLHRLATWAESRSWIYYRTKRMPPGAAGLAMLEVTSIIDPAVEHVIEAQREEQARAEQDEGGQFSGDLGEDGDGDPAPGA